MRIFPRRAPKQLLRGAVLAAGLAMADADIARALEIGKPAPDFSLPSTTGEKISLKQYRGQKLVLIEFIGAAFAPT